MEEQIAIYSNLPHTFNSMMNVATCYLEYNNTFLLLKRHPKALQGNKWCLPGGKVEKNESIKACILREINEEIGLDLPSSKTINLGELYIKREQFEFTLHLFTFFCDKLPNIALNLNEHTEAKWLTYHDAKYLPLIIGGLKTINHLLHLKSKKSL
jgi:8-oxo-dGTP pyrophosphatase MutT (NUDIX family)